MWQVVVTLAGQIALAILKRVARKVLAIAGIANTPLKHHYSRSFYVAFFNTEYETHKVLIHKWIIEIITTIT